MSKKYLYYVLTFIVSISILGIFSYSFRYQWFINSIVDQKYKIAIWGASHQGFTLAATTELKKNARYIIDSAPFKQGRFAPASHLPIVAPDYFFEDPVDIILIVAPGYTNEIAKIIENKFGEKVQILVLKTKHIEKYID